MSYDTGWYKSTRSSGSSNACVEVRLTDRAVAVRDSKAPGDGQIVVSHAAWRGFLSRVEQGFCW
ncbi:DUF397 domain-containing protein [Saccharopolyspora elongata]|uniref:DUF397 domain-containing protein n=1 Tax=Saccharopolyspora elongata TaxID=2530387 RepID=A0A4R4Z2U0_9PSEU|nr:DUF397 domain-containing protein [Saccharopolyspora elongata]TDD52285.1 DUF397 domain-containing protein [Saccharopolyspora elongata]